MGLTSATSSVRYTGTAALETYAYTFKIFDDDDLEITVRHPTTYVETVLTKTTHFTVTGVGESSGGNIVLVNGSFAWLDVDGDLDTGWIMQIRRKLSLVQSASIRNQGAYYPNIHEDAFDTSVMFIQQLFFHLSRSLKIPDTVNVADFSPVLPTDIVGRQNKVLVTNSTGSGISIVDADDIVSLVTSGGPFVITNAMSATNVTSMTVDAADYSSADFLVEVIRSTTIFMLQHIVLVRLNGAWVLHESSQIGSGDSHGLTWTVTEAGGIAQVQIASDSSGTGTLKFKRMAFDA